MNRSELLNWLQGEYQKWEALLDEIGPERMEQPGVSGNRSMKDIIADLTIWNRWLVLRLEAAGRGQREPRPPWQRYDLTNDEINAWIYESNRGRSLQKVLDDMKEFHQQLLTTIAELPEDVFFERIEPAFHLVWVDGEHFSVSEVFDHFHHKYEQNVRAWLANRLRNDKRGIMKQALFFEPGEGMRLSARGSTMVFKAVSETTGGAFSLMERELPVSGRRPQPHTHQGPEGFYVLEGQIEFIVGTERRVGGPGFWALVPGGVAHTFGNAGASPAKLLIIHAPAAEAYFVALQELWSRAEPPTPEEERALMKQYGLEPAEPQPPSGVTP